MTEVAGLTLVSMTEVVALTMTEAAHACGVSQSTIKRRRMAGDFPGAFQAEDGTWKIPTPDLLAAGLRPNRPRSATRVSEPVTEVSDQGQADSDLAHARAEVVRLTVELAEERAARRIAEAEAGAFRVNLEDLRLALRAIAGPETAGVSSETPEPAERIDTTRALHVVKDDQVLPGVTPAPPRRRWWRLSRA